MKRVLAITAAALVLSLLAGCIYVGTPQGVGASTATDADVTAGETEPHADFGVVINEYSTSSAKTLVDEDGDFSPWVELYNGTAAEVSLAGVSLSDDPLKTDKWVFPEVSVPAGGYLVVFMSDKIKDFTAGGQLHASFKLNGSEETLGLYASDGKAISVCKVYKLVSNLSCGYPQGEPNTLKFFARPTPGEANIYEGFDSIESARYPKNKQAVITEVAAVNIGGAAAPDGERYDFVELHNPADEPVSLDGYRLSDSPSGKKSLALDGVTIDAGSYFAVYNSDESDADSDVYDEDTREVYASFGIPRSGETLYILRGTPEGEVAEDSFASGRLADGFSSGRASDEDCSRSFFAVQTPGAANPSATFSAMCAEPEFSLDGGYIEAGASLELSAPGGAKIYYTTDGGEPDVSSELYTSPIVVSRTVTVRAKAYLEGALPSEDVSRSFIVGRRHSMPVVFLSTDSANLFDYYTGIFADGPNISAEFPHEGANYWQEWERPVHFEYMDEGGTVQLSFNAGVKVFGQYSRANAQKSVSINLRDKYGPKEICYPFFGEGDVNVFSSLILRNSGQDINRAYIRDGFCAIAVKDETDVDVMNYAPVVVYINGEYYGIYGLREKVNEDYLANHHGIDAGNVDIIKGNSIVKSGDMAAYRELIQYVRTHDLSVEENYEYVRALVDIDELITYWACESFFTNTDTGNIKFYRERTDGAKWRWIMFDMDWALTGSTYEWNYINNYLDPEGHGVADAFDTSLMCALIENPGFRQRLIEINGRLFQTVFAKDRLLAIYDEMIAALEDEMPYHVARWDEFNSIDSWEYQCEKLRGIIEKKPTIFRADFAETFGLSEAEMTEYFGL